MQARLPSFPAIKTWAVVFLFPLMVSVGWCNGQTNATTPSHGNLHPPHEVLAFYYPWYGPTRHWGKVDSAHHDIQNARHYPALGAYDSHDPAIIARHISEAQAHHVTGFISSWWGQGTYEDQAVPLLLAAAGPKHFKVSVYWEVAPGKGGEQIDRAVSDLTYLLTRYGTNRAFLKVDGKPVIFVYGRVMGQVPFAAWPEIIRRARAQAGNFLLVADGYSARNARQFDGLHTYNICGQVKGKTPDDLRAWAAAHYARAVKLARDHGDISCVTVIPGEGDVNTRHRIAFVYKGFGGLKIIAGLFVNFSRHFTQIHAGTAFIQPQKTPPHKISNMRKLGIFSLAVHSWTVVKTGKTVYGRNKTCAAVKGYYPDFNPADGDYRIVSS